MGGTFRRSSNPAINTRGQVTFVAEMTGGAADFAILRGDGEELTPVFVANQMAPGGATFEDFSDPLINKHGQVAAVGLLTNGGAGLFVGDGRDAIAIALDGQAAPGGGNYSGCCSVPLTLMIAGARPPRSTAGVIGNRGICGKGGRHGVVLASNATGHRDDSFRSATSSSERRRDAHRDVTPAYRWRRLVEQQGYWVGTSPRISNWWRELVRSSAARCDGTSTALGQFEMNDEGIVWIGRFAARATAVVFSRLGSQNEDVDGQDLHNRH